MLHTEVLHRTHCTSIEATVTHLQLRCLSHVIRMPEERLSRKVLYGQLHMGQKKQYKDHIKMTMKKCDVTPNQLEETADEQYV